MSIHGAVRDRVIYKNIDDRTNVEYSDEEQRNN